MTKRKRRELFGLRRSFERVIDQAKRSTKSGEKRTAELESELRDISKQIKRTLKRINGEAKRSTDADADKRAQALQVDTLEILQTEMVRLAALHHRQSDVQQISHFIREQRGIIGASIEHGTDNPSLESLDSQISQLHATIAQERVSARRNLRRDWIKFWISILIGGTSLALGLYALIG